MTCSCSKFTKVWAKMQLQGFLFICCALKCQTFSNQYLKKSFSSNLTGEGGKENSFFGVHKAFNIGAQDGARTNKFELKKFFWWKNQEKNSSIFFKKIHFSYVWTMRAPKRALIFEASLNSDNRLSFPLFPVTFEQKLFAISWFEWLKRMRKFFEKYTLIRIQIFYKNQFRKSCLILDEFAQFLRYNAVPQCKKHLHFHSFHFGAHLARAPQSKSDYFLILA